MRQNNLAASSPRNFVKILNMKSYIVYDEAGEERMTIRAPSHNLAEVVAKKMFGENASVCYTEV